MGGEIVVSVRTWIVVCFSAVVEISISTRSKKGEGYEQIE